MASQQNAGTPLEFLQAVERDFGIQFGFDICCTTHDVVVPKLRPIGYNWLDNPVGYYFDQGVDALKQDWSNIVSENSWLNPPWRKTGKFAEKCLKSAYREVEEDGTTLLMSNTRVWSMFPAGTGSSWWRKYVLDNCAVYTVAAPRVVFVDPRTGKEFVGENGKPQSGFQDTILCDWQGTPGVYSYTWKQATPRKGRKKKEVSVDNSSIILPGS